MRLSSKGYGTVVGLLRTRADLVMRIFAFHEFTMDYESTISALNQKEGSR